MESNARTTSSTAARPIPHDLPVVPGSPDAKLQAVIDAWDGIIPTARQAAGSYTRASLDNAIANQAQDEPRPYDREVLGFQYDRLQADNAFGGAA